MQGTVRRYDAATRAAEVVLDDGTVVRLVPGGLAPAVRALRPGQRLALSGVAGGAARAATLPGLPGPPGPPGPPGLPEELP